MCVFHPPAERTVMSINLLLFPETNNMTLCVSVRTVCVLDVCDSVCVGVHVPVVCVRACTVCACTVRVLDACHVFHLFCFVCECGTVCMPVP